MDMDLGPCREERMLRCEGLDPAKLITLDSALGGAEAFDPNPSGKEDPTALG